MAVRFIGRGVASVDVDEELLGVPVEEGSQVGVKVEADLRVFFAFRGVVVRTTLGSVGRRRVIIRIAELRIASAALGARSSAVGG